MNGNNGVWSQHTEPTLLISLKVFQFMFTVTNNIKFLSGETSTRHASW